MTRCAPPGGSAPRRCGTGRPASARGRYARHTGRWCSSAWSASCRLSSGTTRSSGSSSTRRCRAPGAIERRWWRRELLEQPRERGLAVLEDALEIAAHQPATDPCGARRVLDVVDDPRAVRRRLEAMLVVPPSVGPDNLPVDETDARFPYLDTRPPRYGDAVERDAISDLDAPGHDDGHRCGDVEVQAGRRQALEVGGVGEEGERPLQRSRNHGLAVQLVHSA